MGIILSQNRLCMFELLSPKTHSSIACYTNRQLFLLMDSKAQAFGCNWPLLKEAARAQGESPEAYPSPEELENGHPLYIFEAYDEILTSR